MSGGGRGTARSVRRILQMIDGFDKGEWRDVEPRCAAARASQRHNCVRKPADRRKMSDSNGANMDWA